MACTTHTIPPIYPEDDMTPPTNGASRLTASQIDKIAGAGFPIYTMLAGIKNAPIDDVKEGAILGGIDFDEFVFSVRIFFEMCAMQKVKEIRAGAKFQSGVVVNDIVLGDTVEGGEFIAPVGVGKMEGPTPG